MTVISFSLWSTTTPFFFFETKELRQATAATVISACTEIFATHGLPVRICSDNGPPFSSKAFKDVLASLQIQQVFSSPYHPRSNGMAERAVQEAKKLLIKCSRDKVSFCLALLEWRNTPRDAHLKSPVQRLMGRQTRTLLPVTTSHMKPETVPTEVVTSRLKEIRDKQKASYDRTARQLPDLRPGFPVTVYDSLQRTWTPAVIEGTTDAPRSYVVTTEDGQSKRRTREDLRLLPTNTTVENAPSVRGNGTADTSSQQTPPGDDQVGHAPSPADEDATAGATNVQSATPERRSTRLRRKPQRYPTSERKRPEEEEDVMGQS